MLKGRKAKSKKVYRGVVLWKLAGPGSADDKFSKFIRARDEKCFFYGIPQPGRSTCYNQASQNSHYWGRQKMSTRFDPENCDGICGECHSAHEGDKNGLYRELKIKQLGQKKYDELEARSKVYKSQNDAIYDCMEFLKTRPGRS